jgi:hypothetical protein
MEIFLVSLQIIVGGAVSAIAGWYLVDSLSRVNRETKDPLLNTQKLASYSFLTPIALFILLQMGFIHGFINKYIVDSCTVGVVIGILRKLSSKPQIKNQNIKLTVKELTGRQADIWIDSVDTPIGQVRQKIAEAFGVKSASQILMESGRGTVIGDVSIPLSTLISEATTTIDFFGCTSTCCYVTISQSDERNSTDISTPSVNTTKPAANNTFLSLLNAVKEKACFGDLLLLSAKIPNAGTDRSSFSVCYVDKFAAAAPLTAQTATHNPIRLIAWGGAGVAADARDARSETGSMQSSSFVEKESVQR